MSVEQSLSSPCTRIQGAQSLEDATEGRALELMTQSLGNVGTVTRRSLPFSASFEALSTSLLFLYRQEDIFVSRGL